MTTEAPPAGGGDSPGPAAAIPLDRIARGLALVGAVSYVLGLVVVNTYLLRLGVADFDLLRPRFVATGLVVLLLAVGSLLPLLIAVVNGEDVWPGRDRAVTENAGRVGGLVILVLGLPIFLLAGLWDIGFGRALMLYGFSFGVAAVAALLGLTVASRSFTRAWTADQRVGGIVSLSVVLALALFFHVGWFARAVYPRIPEQFGGGRPQAATLVIDPALRVDLEELGLGFRDGSEAITDVAVLFEGSDYLLVAAPRGLTIRVDNDRVLAIRVDR